MSLTWNDPILQGAARALFVQAYASRQEERRSEGRKVRVAGPGEDWMDVAPKTSRDAVVAAAMLLAKLEERNGGSVLEILYRAARADGMDGNDTSGQYRTDFGHYIAMQAVGHGVSWFDNHARFELFIPHCEFSL